MNNNQNNVYGAVIMTQSHCKSYPLHVMNAEQCQMAADLWIKPTDLSRWPACRQLCTAVTIYYYSAQKLILIVNLIVMYIN